MAPTNQEELATRQELCSPAQWESVQRAMHFLDEKIAKGAQMTYRVDVYCSIIHRCPCALIQQQHGHKYLPCLEFCHIVAALRIQTPVEYTISFTGTRVNIPPPPAELRAILVTSSA